MPVLDLKLIHCSSGPGQLPFGGAIDAGITAILEHLRTNRAR
jgi:hypothetical protein